MQVSTTAKLALAAASVVGTALTGTAIGWGHALQDDGNRGGDAAGALAASFAGIGTFYATAGAADALGTARPIAAMGAAMLGAGAAGYALAYHATKD